MPIQLFQVDAFTGEMFKGNPAAVCLLTEGRPDEWMLNLAAEMNLSETAFVLPLAEGGFSLRWFTPKMEVNLCGHATLASAHTLFERGIADGAEPVRFSTRSSWLLAQRRGEGIELDFPALPLQAASAEPDFLNPLGLQSAKVMMFGNKHLIEIESAAELGRLQPDYPALGRLAGRGVAVTARADAGSGYDFVSRYFAPWVGIDEDPVTGSAHCALGPYWAEKLGKNELRARQASERGGELEVRVTPARVYLTGQAVTVFAGEMPLD